VADGLNGGQKLAAHRGRGTPLQQRRVELEEGERAGAVVGERSNPCWRWLVDSKPVKPVESDGFEIVTDTPAQIMIVTSSKKSRLNGVHEDPVPDTEFS
jgi:hypothetical protein